MSQPNIGTLRAVADRLDNLGLNYAFIGGSVVSLLLDDPESRSFWLNLANHSIAA